MGKSQINGISGKITLFIDGRASDYEGEISTLSGGVRVNEKTNQFSVFSRSAEHSLEIETISGGISVNFSEDTEG